eukprot:GHVH01004142.1.p1 GENE.GHVH01004142.1~~GHVH01004142.1.p1  ORF type:complete len:610 (-),score=68.15 GHVH01004142.1:981-2810(-)
MLPQMNPPRHGSPSTGQQSYASPPYNPHTLSSPDQLQTPDRGILMPVMSPQVFRTPRRMDQKVSAHRSSPTTSVTSILSSHASFFRSKPVHELPIRGQVLPVSRSFTFGVCVKLTLGIVASVFCLIGLVEIVATSSWNGSEYSPQSLGWLLTDVDGNRAQNLAEVEAVEEVRDPRMVRNREFPEEVRIDRPNAPPVVKHAHPGPTNESAGLDSIKKNLDELGDRLFKRVLPPRKVVASGLGLGPSGEPLWEVGRTPRQMTSDELREVLNKSGGFNVALSDSLPLVRPFGPPTPHACTRTMADFTRLIAKTTAPDSPVKSASIIIPIHNEPLSLILRTLHTLFERTSRPLVKEVLIVDDGSDVSWIADDGRDVGYRHYTSDSVLSEPLHLSTYLSSLPGVIRMFRTTNDRTPKGTNFAKNLGLQQATGDVVVFLDAHVEVGEWWLEPIMERLYDNQSVLIVPRVHHMIPETFTASKSIVEPPVGFFWKLLETPLPPVLKLPKMRLVEPKALENYPNKSSFTPILTSPVLAGGMFAVHRRSFIDDRGGIDVGMPGTSGMEGLELSLRVWMTGGRIEYLRCSNIQHLFRRKSTDMMPGSSSDGPSVTLQISL